MYVVKIFSSLLWCSWISILYSGWVDPDSKQKDFQRKSHVDGRTYDLVFSDEFNVEDRTFHDGEDPRWTAMNKDDYTNFALHYYNHDLARTSKGMLNISTIVKDISFKIEPIEGSRSSSHMTKNYQSAMIQGWNKFCFTGGIVEISAQLPGLWNVGGLWPAMWLLGNLARATYVGSSNNIWPWSFDECSKKLIHQQEISKCRSVNYYGMKPNQGRGAPEIDILESMSGDEQLISTTVHRPYFSTSLQVAPGLDSFRPDVATRPPPGMWYEDGITYAEGNETDLNVFFYGMHLEGSTPEKSYLADALSANTNLYETHFTELHKYRLEWIPGPAGYLKWYLDDKFLYSIEAKAFNKTGAEIPEEPMYLLFNTAVSSTWGFPVPCPEGCPCDCFDPRKIECECAIPPNMKANFPAFFLIDYVRVYQAAGDNSQIIGCSTPDHPTKKFIEGQPSRYMGKTDKQPMKPVPSGGATCTTNTDCFFGSCEKDMCACSGGYTGPNCKSAIGFDDVVWDTDETITLVGMMVPLALAVLALLLGLFLVTAAFWRVADSRLERGLVSPPPPDQRTWTTLWSRWVARNHHWYTPIPAYDDSATGTSPRDLQSNGVTSSGRYQT